MFVPIINILLDSVRFFFLWDKSKKGLEFYVFVVLVYTHFCYCCFNYFKSYYQIKSRLSGSCFRGENENTKDEEEEEEKNIRRSRCCIRAADIKKVKSDVERWFKLELKRSKGNIITIISLGFISLIKKSIQN